MTTYVGIVGAEAAKFTLEGEVRAKTIIRRLLQDPEVIVVSGGCHLGGVDIWAEELAAELGRETVIYKPAELRWATGFKPRNMQIAQRSDVVHNITVAAYPPTFTGMRFAACYHCITQHHVKSGGCWTAKYAKQLGKPAYWHIV